MFRTRLALVLMLTAGSGLVTDASAQRTPQTAPATKALTSTRHAGIYHTATGTWTRTASAAAGFGPDVIYSNTAESGYFTSAGGFGGFAPGSTNYDEGGIPGSTNSNHPADRDEYVVNGLQIGYCDSGAAATAGWELSFYNSYAPCGGIAVPDATILTSGLPAAGACWTIELDLTGGAEFCLAADGGNGFDDDVDLDAFGWSYSYAGTGGAEAGFLLTGDPLFTDPNFVTGGDPIDGTNTYFGPPSLCSPEEATGLLTQDQWYLEDPSAPANDGCYWFGGYSNSNGCGGPANPYASFFMEAVADTGACVICLTFCEFCLSNPNSTGVNSTLAITGSPSIADNDVTLTATVPPNVVGFYITSQEQGFTPNPAGSAGNLCLGNNIGRFQQLAASSGSAGTIAISTTAGQWSLGAIPQPGGTYSAIPGGTANFQLWHRDTSPAGPTSNFTDGATITWLP